MRGILAHLLSTLRLNFRARQALVYGYVVPVFFLLAFGSVFHSSVPPLLHEMGQLITITILGGACFGMPASIVSERERGVWRRYRLLPASTAGLIVSAMVARYLIVLLAVAIQIALAWCLYRTPIPAHPLQLLVAYTDVCFAFLGMGLIIAMVAGAVPAVQALGQAIFLPMIMIGGVGVPLRVLPAWAQRVAGFLPGRYAVEALDACYRGGGAGLAGSRFALGALLVIGGAACLAGARMFRWDSARPLPRGVWPWLALALAAWAAVGVAAERRAPSPPAPARPAPAAAGEPWDAITPAMIHAVSFANLQPDDAVVTPIARNIADLPAASLQRVEGIRDKLDSWPPAGRGDLAQRVRALLSAAAVFDVLEDPDEGAVAYVILDEIRQLVPDDELARVLVYIIDNPSAGAVVTEARELGADGRITEEAARDRAAMYARKLLRRVLGK